MKSVLYSLLSSSDWYLSAGHQTRGEWSWGEEVRHWQRKDREWGGKVKEERGAQQKRREERRQQKRVKGQVRGATERRSEGGSPSELTGFPVGLLITGMLVGNDRVQLCYSDPFSVGNKTLEQVAFVQASKRHHHHGDRGAELEWLGNSFPKSKSVSGRRSRNRRRHGEEWNGTAKVRRVNLLPMRFLFHSPLPWRRVRIAREDIQVVLLAGEEKEENEETKQCDMLWH